MRMVSFEFSEIPVGGAWKRLPQGITIRYSTAEDEEVVYFQKGREIYPIPSDLILQKDWQAVYDMALKL